MNQRTRNFSLTGVIVISLALIAGFGFFKFTDTEISFGDLPIFEQVNASRELIVLTRNAPTTYFQGKKGIEGFEYDLVDSFARHLGVQPRFVVKDSISDILTGLENGEGQIAAAGLSKTRNRRNKFLFGPEYQTVEQQLICRRGIELPKNIEDLLNYEIWATADSSYIETLNHLQKNHPTLKWRVSTEFDTEQLLERVWLKKIQCTVADSNIVAINRRYFPELVIAMKLSDAQSLTWLLPQGASRMQSELHNWLMTLKRDGELSSLIERHYGFIEIFDYVDVRRFNRRMKKRLPRYQKHFLAAADKYDISWTLLAAQSYQESHWRPRAKSPTGVRGMMMLTLETARDLGIKSRLNAKMSIYGGAKYLSQLRKRLPKDIAEPDRTWFALAAYNVGMGHIYDARKLARMNGKNPSKWRDIASVLPLLSQKRYYKKLKYGYARGREPVRYVQRIRDFRDILERELSVVAQKSSEDQFTQSPKTVQQ